ncbi:MAG: MFS transporter [Spirochaetaceae bacterium]|jgi:Na+/melibiose symporter-like transporter|nr:MFS transporter [Spirochaetaceae bacterium]
MEVNVKREVRNYGIYNLVVAFVMVPLGFLNIFLTEDLKLTAIAVGSILLVARVADFVISFSVGAIIERSKFKSGKYLPWLKYTKWIIYFAQILMFLPFEIPFALRSVLIVVSYLLINVTWAFVTTVQYGTLSIVAGSDMDKRNKMMILGVRLMTVATVITSATNAPVRNLIASIVGPKYQYLVLSIIYGLFYVVATMLLANLIRPYDGPQVNTGPARPQVTIKDMVKCVVTNSQLIVNFASTILVFLGMMAPMQIVMYYYIYIQNDPQLLLMTLAMTITTLFSLFTTIVGPMIGLKLGRKKAMVLAQFLSTLTSVAMMFFGGIHIAVFIGINMTTAFCTAMYSGFGMGYIIDVGEYGYWKTGIDNRTVTMSLVNVPIKIATFLGGTVAMFGLGIIGYTPGMEVTAKFTSNFMYLYGGIPAICTFLACILNGFFYKIDDKEAALYARENREREAAKAASAGASV